MIRKFLFFCLFVAAIACGFYVFKHYEEMKVQKINFPPIFQKNSITTFELLIHPDDLMKKHEEELLKTTQHSFAKPQIKYLPLLLFNVKYSTEEKKTKECKLVWSLESGEMLLDTETFEMTNGFKEFISAQLDAWDFRLIHILMQHIDGLPQEELAEKAGLTPERAFEKIDSLKKKQLLVKKNESIRLHFASPLIKAKPETRFSQQLVTKIISSEHILPAQYRDVQLEKIARAAFTNDFVIRSKQHIFLPVIRLQVENPDSSMRSVYFNGVTGQKMPF